jgi:cell division protein FtsW (lipid II flippase)
LLCLAGNTVLTAAIGAAVIFFSRMTLVPFAIGVGIVAYGGAVAFYTLLALWRMRGVSIRRDERAARNQAAETAMAAAMQRVNLAPAYARDEVTGK